MQDGTCSVCNRDVPSVINLSQLTRDEPLWLCAKCAHRVYQIVRRLRTAMLRPWP